MDFSRQDRGGHPLHGLPSDPRNGTPATESGSPPPPSLRSTPNQRPIWRDLLIGLLALGLIGWGVFVGGRALAGYLARQLPYSVDRAIGGAAAASVTGGEEVCTNPLLVSAVRTITEHLASGLDPEMRDVTVTVVGGSAINAFALPGGFVYVYTGLLAEIEAPEELIGVLGHELGHVAHRHGIVRIAESVWIRFLLSQLIGDAGGLQDSLTAKAVELVSLKFDRDQESESDTFGLELMRQVGYEPGAFPDFFGRLESQGVPELLSTHPNPEGRQTALREAIAQLPRLDRPVAPPPLAELQAPCHALP